jgi:hypothetical protein
MSNHVETVTFFNISCMKKKNSPSMNGLQVSSHPQSILGLCAFFEHLLQKHEPELWTHLLSAEVQPTKVKT